MNLQDYLFNLTEASTKVLKMLLVRSTNPLQIAAAESILASRSATPVQLENGWKLHSQTL
jgi:hypothetical protein